MPVVGQERNMPPSSCPTRQELERLLSGLSTILDIDRLAQHVECCDQCGQTIDAIPVGPPLANILRAGQTPLPPEATVQVLIERLKVLCASATHATPAPTGERYDFLAPPQGPDELGRLGPYRVLRVLGTGGMGVVFAAEDSLLKRPVALKAMLPAAAASASAKQRFLREAQLAASIEHDHIVTIYQVGEDRGVPFLAMQLLKGEPLDERLKRAPRLSAIEVARLGGEIAEGLAAAHERGLIHRDVKPANVWLEAPSGRVKLLDFGLARAVVDDTHLTRSGALIGTPRYMAPEQAAGEVDRIGPATDTYGLGVVLYEMLTGCVPFEGPLFQLLNQIVNETPPPPSQLAPNLDRGLERIVLKALARRPEERYPSARALGVDLDHWRQQASEGAGTATKASPPRAPRAWLSHRSLVAAAAVLLIGAGLAVLTRDHPDQTRAPLGWVTKAPMATPRTNFMTAEVGGRLYVVGGISEEGALRTVEVYDPATDQWQGRARLPNTDPFQEARYGGAIGAIDGKLYLAGGWRLIPPLPTDTLQIYDPAQDRWSLGPRMPLLSCEACAAVIDGKFYVVIGNDGYSEGGGRKKFFYVYDPAVQRWSRLPDKPRARGSPAGGVIQGKLYVAGGEPEGESESDALDVYDPFTNKWEMRAPLPTPRGNTTGTAYNGKLYVLGGNHGKQTLDTMEVYDPGTDLWTAGPALPGPRSGARACVIGSTLYLVGGSDGKQTQASLFAIDLSKVGAASEKPER
jgi:N-acetylneuraminic acid mutarotase